MLMFLSSWAFQGRVDILAALSGLGVPRPTSGMVLCCPGSPGVLFACAQPRCKLSSWCFQARGYILAALSGLGVPRPTSGMVLCCPGSPGVLFACAQPKCKLS